MAKLIDTNHMGRDRVIGAWLDGEVLVDPGPASTLDALLDGLGGVEPRAILLTHIHLDHAAATGALVRRFPDVRVYVHEIGAPHMADPRRLLESAARLYGADRMDALWGEVLPVPEASITTLAGGERVEGFEVIHAPGHAAHHVVYLDHEGTAYVGDLGGVRIPPGEVTIAPTPPPEIDVEAWFGSLDRLAKRAPERLRLTHFGEIEPAAAQLEAVRLSLGWSSQLAAEGEREDFLAALHLRIDDQPAEAAESMRAAMPPEQVWMGLERYWRKRRDAGAKASGDTATS